MAMTTITVDVDDDVLALARTLVPEKQLNDFVVEAIQCEIRRAELRRLFHEETSTSPEIPEAVREEMRRQCGD